MIKASRGKTSYDSQLGIDRIEKALLVLMPEV